MAEEGDMDEKKEKKSEKRTWDGEGVVEAFRGRLFGQMSSSTRSVLARRNTTRHYTVSVWGCVELLKPAPKERTMIRDSPTSTLKEMRSHKHRMLCAPFFLFVPDFSARPICTAFSIHCTCFHFFHFCSRLGLSFNFWNMCATKQPSKSYFMRSPKYSTHTHDVSRSFLVSRCVLLFVWYFFIMPLGGRRESDTDIHTYI